MQTDARPSPGRHPRGAAIEGPAQGRRTDAREGSRPRRPDRPAAARRCAAYRRLATRVPGPARCAARRRRDLAGARHVVGLPGGRRPGRLARPRGQLRSVDRRPVGRQPGMAAARSPARCRRGGGAGRLAGPHPPARRAGAGPGLASVASRGLARLPELLARCRRRRPGAGSRGTGGRRAASPACACRWSAGPGWPSAATWWGAGRRHRHASPLGARRRPPPSSTCGSPRAAASIRCCRRSPRRCQRACPSRSDRRCASSRPGHARDAAAGPGLARPAPARCRPRPLRADARSRSTTSPRGSRRWPSGWRWSTSRASGRSSAPSAGSRHGPWRWPRGVAPLPVRAGVGDNRWLAVLAARLARPERPKRRPPSAPSTATELADLPALPAARPIRPRASASRLFGLTDHGPAGRAAALRGRRPVRRPRGAAPAAGPRQRSAAARAATPPGAAGRAAPLRAAARTASAPSRWPCARLAAELCDRCAPVTWRPAARASAQPGGCAAAARGAGLPAAGARAGLDRAPAHRSRLEAASRAPAARSEEPRSRASALSSTGWPTRHSRQLPAFEAQAGRWEELRWSLERLAARFGDGRLWRAEHDPAERVAGRAAVAAGGHRLR